MIRIAVLGSSGSIGTQTLDVCRQHPDLVSVKALSVNSNVDLLAQQARDFNVKKTVVAKEACAATQAVRELMEAGVSVGVGHEAILDLVCDPEVDCVVNALVGAAGLAASYATLQAGKRLALANKESLVVGGDLLMPMSCQAELLPIDSEHGAVFQCLQGERAGEVDRLWITASGGPFRGRSRQELAKVTRDDALAHPTWKMGPKITIDSATLMNKGLEVIEAHHLFAADFDRISVVVHPQSCIHSMVAYKDGSVKAHLGVTDMRIPIQYALSYPDRWDAPCQPMDFTQLHDLTFGAPDMETFRCLKLALEAGRCGGTAPCVLNAANEVAVAAFLAQTCAFTDIDGVVEEALDKIPVQPVESLEQLAEVDRQARDLAAAELASLQR